MQLIWFAPLHQAPPNRGRVCSRRTKKRRSCFTLQTHTHTQKHPPPSQNSTTSQIPLLWGLFEPVLNSRRGFRVFQQLCYRQTLAELICVSWAILLSRISSSRPLTDETRGAPDTRPFQERALTELNEMRPLCGLTSGGAPIIRPDTDD